MELEPKEVYPWLVSLGLGGLTLHAVPPNAPSGLESISNNGETLGGGSKRGEFGRRFSF